jgi:hypothetical protein
MTTKELLSLDKIRRYGVMRWEQLLKRRIFLRKPLGYLFRLREYCVRRRHASRIKLGSDHAEILSGLRENGFAAADELISKQLLSELDNAASERLGTDLDTMSANQTKAFMFELLQSIDYDGKSPFIKVALENDLIRVVSSYLGQVPHLNGMTMFATRATEDPEWRVSQRWHRDYDDKRMVKLFIFVTDVEEPEHGPLTLIPARVGEQMRDRLYPIHKTDDLMKTMLPDMEPISLFCKRLSCYLVDTHRCYHLGSRVTGDRVRLAYQICFTSCSPYYRGDIEIKNKQIYGELEELVLS